MWEINLLLQKMMEGELRNDEPLSTTKADQRHNHHSY